MTAYDYLIIGGGMTAAAGVDGIREIDPRREELTSNNWSWARRSSAIF